MKPLPPIEIIAKLRETINGLDHDQRHIGLVASHAELKRLLQRRINDLEAALAGDPDRSASQRQTGTFDRLDLS